jgi:catechol 2,3-dioxygenase-like lactoylglutathione lyase family enzyme
MLGDAELIAFVPTRDAARATAFYAGVLGLRLVAEEAFAQVFDAGGTMLRVARLGGDASYQPPPFTLVGWRVPDAQAAARQLGERGVEMLRYAGMEQDELGIWTAPGGARVAWFRDPDGNVLSISQF